MIGVIKEFIRINKLFKPDNFVAFSVFYCI